MRRCETIVETMTNAPIATLLLAADEEAGTLLAAESDAFVEPTVVVVVVAVVAASPLAGVVCWAAAVVPVGIEQSVTTTTSSSTPAESTTESRCSSHLAVTVSLGAQSNTLRDTSAPFDLICNSHGVQPAARAVHAAQVSSESDGPSHCAETSATNASREKTQIIIFVDLMCPRTLR
eukprot:TRINITY_DN1956_c0_g1_i1.p2 TRINITY_DN1956_c0_g1~~TRINITY_DN1956_c0_g1_i1.p2  ORF type:complete len:177 (-),score=25.81 TRINITY_DN1956_c0_g1_i1:4-534(-)